MTKFMQLDTNLLVNMDLVTHVFIPEGMSDEKFHLRVVFSKESTLDLSYDKEEDRDLSFSHLVDVLTSENLSDDTSTL